MAEITIKDIARECGVGISTVSRAINNHADINPETKQMVMDKIKETGYIPNNSARNLKRTDARCIAVLIKGITNPFFSPVIQIIEAQAQKKRYAMVLQHIEAYEDEVEVALELVKEKRLRGIIFLGGAYQHNLQQLEKLKVPFVFSTIGVTHDGEKKTYSNVAVDDRVESRKMTDYLIGLGHRRIAIITECMEARSIGTLRLEGYKDALITNGLEIDERLIFEIRKKQEPYTMENGYQMAKELLDSGIDFTAVFAIADSLAVGVCRALYEAGMRIPEDVSVAGYDGIPIGEFYTPQLTTIRQPVELMAEKTIKLLFDMIDGRSKYEHMVFPAELIERESTAKLINRK